MLTVKFPSAIVSGPNIWLAYSLFFCQSWSLSNSSRSLMFPTWCGKQRLLSALFLLNQTEVSSPFFSVLLLLSSRSLLWDVQELHTVFYMWSHLPCAISIPLISLLEMVCQHTLELPMSFSCLNHTSSLQTSCDSSITQARCFSYFPTNLHLISSSWFLFSKSACPFIVYQQISYQFYYSVSHSVLSV